MSALRTARIVTLVALAWPLSTVTRATAQDLEPKAPSQRGAIVLEGGFVHSVDGRPTRTATIWFEDGVLRGIGDVGDPAPADARRIDVRGRHVYPGLISAHTQLGLREIGAVRATVDVDEVGAFTPEVRAAVAINPDSTVIPVTRRNGVLVAGVFPTGGDVPGRAAVIELEGWTWEEMALSTDCGVVVDWPSLPRIDRGDDARKARSEAEETRRRIDSAFRDARAASRERELDPSLPHDVHAEALAGVLSRAQPVFVRADRLEEITSAVDWARSLDLRLVILGGLEAPLCLELLIENDVAVVVTGTHRLPSRRDAAVDAPFRLPLALEDARIRWCLASGEEFFNERNLPYHAATAIAHGLAPEAGLRAVTQSAAEILGVADRVGSLEIGKHATLIVTDGDPLEVTTRVEMAFVRGRQSTLSTKQTRLAEKYRAKYRER